MRVGLLGGSFDPAHQGHRHVALLALRRLELDQVWWLASPHNPLKPDQPAGLDARLAAAAAAADHPRIAVSGVEDALGTRFTHDTLRVLRPALARLRAVWLMGADGLRDFHRWRRWREIAELLPIAVIDRPGASLAALAAPAARALAGFRLPEGAAAALPGRPPPAWVFLHGPRLALSSSALRGPSSNVLKR